MGQSQITDYRSETSGVVNYNGLPQNLSDPRKSEPERGQRAEGLVVVVDKRALERECLARGLVEHNPGLKITAVGSLDEFQTILPNGG